MLHHAQQSDIHTSLSARGPNASGRGASKAKTRCRRGTTSGTKDAVHLIQIVESLRCILFAKSAVIEAQRLVIHTWPTFEELFTSLVCIRFAKAAVVETQSQVMYVWPIFGETSPSLSLSILRA